ncbi:ankyrin repeat-containing domain protein [Aspergillus cavernicola]|uniref:Ankyrin repeat-containing domain protein n=1 Tax=Aspergillus cavernicola TaxID=176166 RepID=A0ABR4IL89_9EURO
MSCFGCFKSKSRDKEEADDGQDEGAYPKPNNISQAPPSLALPQVAKVPSFIEEPSPQEHDADSANKPGTADDETEPPLVDRWQGAFNNLPDEKQKVLKDMGFDKAKSKSANMTSDISDLIAAVNVKQKECEKKFWRINIGGKDIVLRDYTTSIIGWLEKAGDIAIQFAPPQVSLPWDLVKSIMQIPVNEGEQMCALLATTESIVRITSRGLVYEQVYLSIKSTVEKQSISKQLEGTLMKIYTTSLELLADSGKLLDHNTARRVLEAIVNPGSFQDQLSGLKEEEEEFLRDVQACEVQRSFDADNTMIDMLKTFNDPILRVDAGVAHLLTQMEERDRTAMLEWISPVLYGKHHNSVRENRTPGTGEWLLQYDSFRNWEITKSSLLFWLQGSPGTGKTYLTSTIIDYVRGQIATKNEGFAFFYCSKGDPSRVQPQSILQSFVRQLSTNTNNPKSVQTKLCDAVKEARDNGTNFRLQQCKDQILASLNIYARSTLVIDALDECDSDSRNELIGALNWFLGESQKPVKIFVSSRLEPDIAAELEQSPNVGIQADDNQDDIKKYLDIELDKQAKRVAVLKRMKSEIIDKLLERAQGMFQWAVLQVHQLSKCQSAPSVRERLNKLPATLKDSYDEVWAQINALEENDRMLATRALLWTMAACKPFTNSELLYAIRVDPSNGTISPLDEMLDKNGLLSICNGFLTIDSQLREWHFPHLSVQEYLESKEYVSASQAHLHAAKVSLLYFINFYKDHDMEQQAELENLGDYDNKAPGAMETDDGFNKWHPFHLYMRQCWVQHVQRIKDDPDVAVLSPMLKTFLGSPNESSVQYRRWYCQTRNDFDHMDRVFGFEYYYEPRFGEENFIEDLRELQPENYAVFAMCQFSFDIILSDWWQVASIDISCVNSRGHNLLAIAARAGSLQICKWLVGWGIDVNLKMKGVYHGSALVAAASQGHNEVVKYLMETGGEVNMMTTVEGGSFDNALAAAIYSGSLETIEYLILNGADIYSPLPRSRSGFALGEASYIQGTGMLKLLLDAGADVNMRLNCPERETVLVGKIMAWELDSVKYLVQEANADINMPLLNDYGNALEVAARSSKELEMIKWLLTEGRANVNTPSRSGNQGSPLAAAVGNRLEVVMCLVEFGADVDMPLLVGGYGSALAVACAQGENEIVQYLLSVGADPNMPLVHGIFGSALAAACAKDEINIIRYLLSAGADPNMPLAQGRFGSALAAAAYESTDDDILRALVNAGADINMQLEHVEFGCALAAAGARRARGNNMVFPYLVEAGADINMPLKHGLFGSSFAATVWGGHFDRIELLVDKGVDVNMPLENNDFSNPLAMFVAFNCAELTIDYLVEIGVDINPQHGGKIYGSPLIAAAAFGSTDCVEILIVTGADVNRRYENSFYPTALQAAQAEFSPKDKDWMLRFFGDENKIQDVVEQWREDKPKVVEILLQHGATA